MGMGDQGDDLCDQVGMVAPSLYNKAGICSTGV
jgi:hypothetical protein